jgi:hypothetical protein
VGKIEIGVIVDGPGDFASLRARFAGLLRVLKADGPRGHTVGIRTLVSTARKQIALLRASGCRKAILLVDFEQRTVAYETFVRDGQNEVVKLASPIEVVFASPNRMIENWYLADIEELSRVKAYIRDGITQKNFEGSHGKKDLSTLFVRGISYNEVKHGPDMFVTIRMPTANQNSPSLRHFCDHAECC